MKRTTLLTLLGLVAFVVLAHAQTNYKSGFLLKASGDTLRGYINYHEWEISPKFIEFKSDLNSGTPQRFLPSMLRGFEISGMDKYMSYAGKLSMDNNVFPDLPSKPDTTTIQDTVFLQVKYQGAPLTLLKNEDKLKTRFFIQENSEKPVELIYHLYYQDETITRSRDLFKNQLLVLANKYGMGNNERLEREITSASFSESAIRNIVKHINNDKLAATDYSGTTGFRLFAGIAFYQITSKFNGANPFSGNGSSTTSPRVSAGADIFLNKHTQRLIFRTELAFWNTKPQFSATNRETYSSYAVQYQYGFKQFNASLIPQIIYSLYNKDNFKVYVGAGFGLNYSFYSNNKYTENMVPSYNVPEKTNTYDLESFWFSMPLQAGVTVNKKFELFAIFTPPVAITKYSLFSISNATKGAGVRYLFK